MIEDLQRKMIRNLMAAISDKNIDDIEMLGSIKKGSMVLQNSNSGEGRKMFFASLMMDCPKLPLKEQNLNYCVGISAEIFTENNDALEVLNFFVQEQAGISHGFPVHRTISDNEQILLVLQTFNKELDKLNGKNIGSDPSISMESQQVVTTQETSGKAPK